MPTPTRSYEDEVVISIIKSDNKRIFVENLGDHGYFIKYD